MTPHRAKNPPAASRLKRAIDIFVSLTVLIAVLPSTLALLLMLRRNRRGAILDPQNVVGMGGRTFRKWSWSKSKEGEANRSERILHNELSLVPTLINVLAGDMALVGPTPRTSQELASLAAITSDYRLILTARPGAIGVGAAQYRMTGRVAQLRRELEYVENWRLATDLAVISHRALTFPFKRDDFIV